jgi:hypothetical protein
MVDTCNHMRTLRNQFKMLTVDEQGDISVAAQQHDVCNIRAIVLRRSGTAPQIPLHYDSPHLHACTRLAIASDQLSKTSVRNIST